MIEAEALKLDIDQHHANTSLPSTSSRTHSPFPSITPRFPNQLNHPARTALTLPSDQVRVVIPYPFPPPTSGAERDHTVRFIAEDGFHPSKERVDQEDIQPIEA